MRFFIHLPAETMAMRQKRATQDKHFIVIYRIKQSSMGVIVVNKI